MKDPVGRVGKEVLPVNGTASIRVVVVVAVTAVVNGSAGAPEALCDMLVRTNPFAAHTYCNVE